MDTKTPTLAAMNEISEAALAFSAVCAKHGIDHARAIHVSVNEPEVHVYESADLRPLGGVPIGPWHMIEGGRAWRHVRLGMVLAMEYGTARIEVSQ